MGDGDVRLLELRDEALPVGAQLVGSGCATWCGARWLRISPDNEARLLVQQLIDRGVATWVRAASTRPRRSAEEEIGRLASELRRLEANVVELSSMVEELRHVVHQKCGVTAPTLQWSTRYLLRRASPDPSRLPNGHRALPCSRCARDGGVCFTKLSVAHFVLPASCQSGGKGRNGPTRPLAASVNR